MKKSAITLIFLVCFYGSYATTRDSTKTFYKNEISTFAGFVAWEQYFAIVGEGIFNFSSVIDTGFQINRKIIHPIGLSYKHYFTKMWCITSSFSYARTYQNHNYTNPIYSFKKYDNIFSLMVGAECHYYNSKIVSLYSGLSIGGFIWQNKVVNIDETNKTIDGFIAFQVNAFGIRVGKRIAGFAEIGFGNSGIINGGLSIKF